MNTDVTKSVMEKVTTFERKRSRRWLRVFWVIVVTLLIAAGINAWYVWGRLTESQTLDLLTIVNEDAEIIREFWQDTAVIFLEELPVVPILLTIITIFGLGLFVYETRQKRKIMKRRLTELAKKPKS